MSPRTVIGGVLRRRPQGSMLEEPVGRSRPVRMQPQGFEAPVGVGGRVVPLAGPLAVRPVEISRHTAAEMLQTAVEGLLLGRADEALLARWSDVLDPADAVIMASLIQRARIEGPSVYAAPVQSVTGWVTVCSPCRTTSIEPAPSRAEAETLATTHDQLHHGGRGTCEVVPSHESMTTAVRGQGPVQGGAW